MYTLTDLETEVYERGGTLFVELPLPMMKSGALFTLNRKNNTHFQVYKQIKNDYKNIVKNKLKFKGKRFSKLEIHYAFYLTKGRSNKKPDLDNISSMTKKFFNDAIKEIGLIEDDNMDYVVKNVEEYKGISNTDKVEIYMIQVNDREVSYWIGDKPKLTRRNTYKYNEETFFYCKKDCNQKADKLYHFYRYSDGILVHRTSSVEAGITIINELWEKIKARWNL